MRQVRAGTGERLWLGSDLVLRHPGDIFTPLFWSLHLADTICVRCGHCVMWILCDVDIETCGLLDGL